MRTDREVFDLIVRIAEQDERIRAVVLSGSRANPEIPKDEYQDFDVTYYVIDMTPYTNQPKWVEEHLGYPLIMQMPEAMRDPDGGGHFTYLVLFPDGRRIDLTFEDKPYKDTGEPDIVLLDKDHGSGLVPRLAPRDGSCYHIKPPSELFYYSCCNNYWWCLNNVAKGIARDELPYVMEMFNGIVRKELHDMIEYYIGVRHGYQRSAGKMGKYFKSYLPADLYARYMATYSDGAGIWLAIDAMNDLFHILATTVAEHFGFVYKQDEEEGMRTYLRMVRTNRESVFQEKEQQTWTFQKH